jgi:hypothetical protein
VFAKNDEKGIEREGRYRDDDARMVRKGERKEGWYENGDVRVMVGICWFEHGGMRM